MVSVSVGTTLAMMAASMPLEVDAAQGEHLPDEHGVLVRGAGAGALAADVVEEGGVRGGVGARPGRFEHAEADVGVADVDDQEHGRGA